MSFLHFPSFSTPLFPVAFHKYEKFDKCPRISYFNGIMDDSEQFVSILLQNQAAKAINLNDECKTHHGKFIPVG